MKTILFADNDPDFLIARAELLESKGYKVLKTFTPEEARRFLNGAHIHLAILDIRLNDDDDEKDISGLTLAKDPAYRSIPKIIITGFPNVNAVKEALGPALDGLPPAVDFLTKDEPPEVMVEAVKTAFNFVHINWNLIIQWDSREPLTFPYLVSLLEPDLQNDILIYKASELEDLVRRLFFDYQQIRIGRLLWHDNYRFCCLVLIRSTQGGTDLRILVCGDHELIEQERAQLGNLAPDVLQGTELRGHAFTTHFGANVYGLPGANIEMVQTLSDLVKIGKERPLKTAITQLLGVVLKAWHQHGQIIEETRDLMRLYRQWAGLREDDAFQTELTQQVESLVRLARLLEGLEIELGKGRITFHFPHQPAKTYPDPRSTVCAPLVNYDAQVVCRISPGRLTADNVLVDANLNTWLTDFTFAAQAPQWWDFICLEAALRFDLSQAPDILAWQEFEECLVKPSRLDDGLDQNNVIPELRTGVALIEQVRRQAASETGSNPLPYYGGLLVWVVKAMTQYDTVALYTQADRLRGTHLLLAAAMIAERLHTASEKTQSGGKFRVDDEGRAWIGDNYKTVLVGLRLRLLRCLYNQADQAVSNRTIMEVAFAEKYDPKDNGQKQRIRQEIRRLREEIEPDPDRPRYIITAREIGYRLNLGGEPEK